MSDVNIIVSDIALDIRTIIPATVANSHTGITIKLTCAESQTYGDICQINSSGYAHIANASTISNASGILLSVGQTTSITSNTYLLNGTLKINSSGFTVGGLIYLSTAGVSGQTITQSLSTEAYSVAQVIGVALTTDTILFAPSLAQVEHA